MNTLNQNKSKKFATGWLIVVACMLIQAIPFGVASNIQPQFVSYVVEEKGFTLAGFSLIFTLGTIVSAVASPFIGMMFNKISAKTMYLLGAILSGGGFLAFSMCQELWQFYIVAGIVQVGTSIISSIGIPLLINSWFDDTTKGKALGLAFAGSGLGNIFLQQMTAYSLVNFGSSKSYLMFGALSLIVGIPVSLLFLRMPKNNSEIVKGNKKENFMNNYFNESIEYSDALFEGEKFEELKDRTDTCLSLFKNFSTSNKDQWEKLNFYNTYSMYYLIQTDKEIIDNKISLRKKFEDYIKYFNNSENKELECYSRLAYGNIEYVIGNKDIAVDQYKLLSKDENTPTKIKDKAEANLKKLNKDQH